MARELDLLTLSFKAENDLSSDQYHFVELSAADQVDTCDNIRDVPLGILQNKPAAAGRAAQVMVHGVSKLYTDGTVGGGISVGSWVGTNASGHGIVKATADYTVRGIALSASSALGTIIDVLLVGPGFYRAAGDA